MKTAFLNGLKGTINALTTLVVMFWVMPVCAFAVLNNNWWLFLVAIILWFWIGLSFIDYSEKKNK